MSDLTPEPTECYECETRGVNCRAHRAEAAAARAVVRQTRTTGAEIGLSTERLAEIRAHAEKPDHVTNAAGVERRIIRELVAEVERLRDRISEAAVYLQLPEADDE